MSDLKFTGPTEIPGPLDNPALLSEQVSQTATRLVYMVVRDLEAGEEFARQIRHFGYEVQLVNDIHKMENALAEYKMVAIIVDVSATKDGKVDLDLFAEIQQLNQVSTPIIYISEDDTQSTRLAAIRAGGISFFKKPVDIVALIDRLDSINPISTTDPYRVMIVEDQATIANYYNMVLKMAGMRTEIVTESSSLLQKMGDFHPDLVLMDLYMPEADGIELAKLVRQDDDFVGTPIVFLSTEDDFSKQMEAMSVGGDDFLTKPIKSAHLVALIRSRLERLRRIRAFMVRDSLTGLLNHTAFFGHLIHELSRSKRQNTRLSVAMIDIDRFKLVNDTYGHAVGDTVLKGLSLILKQRLRKSDIIGRYGGEEFIIALVDTDANNAAKVMTEILYNFSQVKHIAPDRSIFTVTFSCGIAEYPSFEGPSLSKAADQALYAAKRAGRNQILIATQ